MSLSYDTAKKLKEVGFPQDIAYYEEFYCNGELANYGSDQGLKDEKEPHFDKEYKLSYTNNEVIKIPTLEELIEVVKNHPMNRKDIGLHSLNGGYNAWARKTHLDEGGDGDRDYFDLNPSEAVANLCLALNKK